MGEDVKIDDDSLKAYKEQRGLLWHDYFYLRLWIRCRKGRNINGMSNHLDTILFRDLKEVMDFERVDKKLQPFVANVIETFDGLFIKEHNEEVEKDLKRQQAKSRIKSSRPAR